jgi:hypothetical protein
MNIILWILQVLVAFLCGSGALWRVANYAKDAQDIASVRALSRGAWILIALIEVVCALGVVVPGFFGAYAVVGAFAAVLAVEQLLLTALHARYFGLRVAATNPALWTLVLSALSAFIAWGRLSG